MVRPFERVLPKHPQGRIRFRLLGSRKILKSRADKILSLVLGMHLMLFNNGPSFYKEERQCKKKDPFR
jgi:hypothetical protein